MAEPIAYIPGSEPEVVRPLARFLPPLPTGIAAAWLQDRFPRGSWLLDPFGADPDLSVEAARAGYRVLVAANNPTSRVLIEAAAQPPSQADLSAALAALGAASTGGERMEPHIQGLYATICAHCGRQVTADAFIWERGARGPYGRIYRCATCGDSGEHPATSEDIDRAAGFAQGGMHRARALERVVAYNDPDRPYVEEALSVYLPRTVYALFNLINKVDGLTLPASRRSALQMLLLYACDQANTLWAHPNTRERPRQLSTPHHFRENNVWMALEQAVPFWAQVREPVPLAIWPALPEGEGGISVFEGRLRDLAPLLPGLDICAVLTALPRPNQAFWTLSALWAGWLWGKEAVGPFKSVLRRRRYDWGWHAAALTSAFSSLSQNLKEGTPVFGLIGEVEPGFLTAAVSSADAASFDLRGIALRKDRELAQVSWMIGKERDPKRSAPETSQQAAIRGSIEVLHQRGQPTGYLRLHAAALGQMAEDGVLQLAPRQETAGPVEPGAEPSPSQNLTLVQSALKEAFTYRSGFLRFGGKEQSLEAGQWWLKDDSGSQRKVPLADRVEIELVRYLLRNPHCSENEVDTEICKLFPGLLTPDFELVSACLESYGEPVSPGYHHWKLRERETPTARRKDIETARNILVQMGEKLGFQVTTHLIHPEAPTPGSTVLLWTEGTQPRFAFTVLASAAISEPLFDTPFSPAAGIQPAIVLPGSRANLIVHKLQTDPQLKAEYESGWFFIKYRHLRQLFENPSITAGSFVEQVLLDPLTYSAPQMRML